MVPEFDVARPRVALMFGGDTSEHGVSCLTAAGVASAIDADRYDVIGIGVTRHGKLVRYTREEVAALRTEGTVLPSVDAARPAEVLWKGDEQTCLATIDDGRLTDVVELDVAFSVIHGANGEDGSLQGLFEIAGLRYVGAGVTASAIAMDKIVMKQVMAAHSIPIGPYVAVLPREWDRDPAACLDACHALELPLYVKPARGGSSMGISKVDDWEQLPEAIEYARGFDPRVVVEQAIDSPREVECAVLGSPEGALASGLGEIRMHTASGFYDFDAKYTPADQVSLDIPARDLDDAIVAEARALAVRVFDAFAVEGLARIDFFVSRGRVIVNELNTMPGFTQYSMYPALWQEAGVEYRDLITRLIELARTRPLGLR